MDRTRGGARRAACTAAEGSDLVLASFHGPTEMSVSAIDWLLEDDAPGVQFLARTRLLGESPESRRNRSLRRRCNEYPPVAGMLARAQDPIAQRFYKKYQGGFWTFIFLAEMQATADAEPIRDLADRILSQQHENGGFSPYGNRWLEIVCLTANLLRALVHFGYGETDDVQRGYRRLAERILPNFGVPCTIIQDYSLLTDCKMTLPQTLRAVAAAPASLPAKEMGNLRQLLIAKMLEIRVYHYVRPDSGRFRKDLVPLRPEGMTQREFTADYRAKPRRLASRSWTRPSIRSRVSVKRTDAGG